MRQKDLITGQMWTKWVKYMYENTIWSPSFVRWIHISEKKRKENVKKKNFEFKWYKKEYGIPDK